MPRTTLLLSLLLLAPLASAEDFTDIAAGLEITSLPSPPRPGDILTWRATVRNNGPLPATRVILRAEMSQARCTEQAIATLAVGEQRSVDCSMVLPRELSVYLNVYAYSNDQADPDQQNNLVEQWIDLVTPPDLTAGTFPPRVVDPALPFTLRVFYGNRSRASATGVVVTIDVPAVESVLGMPDFCSAAGKTVTCNVGNLDGFQNATTIELELLAPDASAVHIPIRVQIHGNEEDLKPNEDVVSAETKTYRTFFVTNTGDKGSGSLREALHDANARCGDGWPCKVSFRIPNASAKWLTIRPETPLPVLRMAIVMDGAMQARYIGDSNPDGPEIELSGAAVREGNGIETTCALEIRGLAINGFPGSGILSSRSGDCFGGGVFGPGGSSAPAIAENFIGTDPTGSTAIPNERGIVFERGWAAVQQNVISGNRRSGIFIDAGAMTISENKIGIDRALTKGLGNGASGIYLGPGSNGTDVIDNYIGFNHHYGVSLHPDADYSSLRGNAFQANGGMGIDFGLDGPTLEVPDASTPQPVRRPVITSARYDAATNQTIIEGTTDTSRERHEVWVAVYANDEPDPSGYGEGQYYLGEVKAEHDERGRFTFTWAGRSPGRWIAATTTRQNIIGLAKTPVTQGICGCGYTTQTSEFSRTVEVQ